MTKKLFVGNVPVGGGAPVSIQSMCNTATENVAATVAQIHALEKEIGHPLFERIGRKNYRNRRCGGFLFRPFPKRNTKAL